MQMHRYILGIAFAAVDFGPCLEALELWDPDTLEMPTKQTRPGRWAEHVAPRFHGAHHDHDPWGPWRSELGDESLPKKVGALEHIQMQGAGQFSGCESTL